MRPSDRTEHSSNQKVIGIQALFDRLPCFNLCVNTKKRGLPQTVVWGKRRLQWHIAPAVYYT